MEITGVIARPPPPLAEGLFDYRDYLQTRGIYYQLKTGSTNDWQLRHAVADEAAVDRPVFELVEEDAGARVCRWKTSRCGCFGP